MKVFAKNGEICRQLSLYGLKVGENMSCESNIRNASTLKRRDVKGSLDKEV